MKTLLLLFPIHFAAAALAQQVHFHQGSWDGVLEEAKKSNKLIFVDVYTDWCGPCKRMDALIFTDPKVSEVLNAYYIPYKADAERGGKQIAQWYQVKGYPTLLFLSPDGSEADRILGYADANKLVNIGKSAFYSTPDGQLFARYETVWQQGKRSPDIADGYLRYLAHYGHSTTQALGEFLRSLPTDSLTLPRTEKLVVSTTQELQGPGWDYLLAHRTSKRCASRLNALLGQFGKRALEEKDRKLLAEYLRKVDEVGPAGWASDLKKATFKADFLIETKEWKDYVAYTQQFVPTQLLPYLTTSNKAVDSLRFDLCRQAIENIGWQYAHYVKDHAAVREAFAWLDQLHQAEERPITLAYQAMLADQLGDNDLRCRKLEAAVTLALSRKESAEEWIKMRKGCE